MAITLSSTCAICRLRISRVACTQWKPGGIQVRGNKKKVLYAQLLQDKGGWGPKGTIVPIRPGPMGAHWYPEKIAAYVPLAKVKEMKDKGIVAKRITTYLTKGQKARRLARGEELEEEDTEPQETADFLRKPIVAQIKPKSKSLKQSEPKPVEQSEPKPVEQSEPKPVEQSEPKPVEQSKPTPEPVLEPLQPLDSRYALNRIIPAALTYHRGLLTEQRHIEDIALGQPMEYASVSVADVAMSIRELIDAEEAAKGRLSIADENVEFVGTTKGLTEVKQLGEFDIEINVKGIRNNPLRRKVRVLLATQTPQDIGRGEEIGRAGETAAGPVKSTTQ